MPRQKYFIAGNWKMNGLSRDLAEISAIREGLSPDLPLDVALFPPLTLLGAAVELVKGASLLIGAQDCHAQVSGAFTGDVSASMIKDLGAQAVIVGHSERRAYHGETDAIVREKAAAAIKAGLLTIICIGETAAERAAGLAEEVCLRQLQESVPAEASAENTVIAYEPVWAIGSGATPSSEDISGIHRPLRSALSARFEGVNHGFRILYGGSVSPANSDALFANPEVDGVLVGGASLKAASFLPIIAAAERASPRTETLR